MRNKGKLLALGLLMSATLAACGKNPQITKFKSDIDRFCTAISMLDTSMNDIDSSSDNARTELLGYLDEVKMEFQHFAELDFPEEYDYLETLADEAGDYMTEAVKYYHEAYKGDAYDEATAAYAQENYSRAFKRIQIIISFLHGEEPDDVDLTTKQETDAEESETE
ncbi:MAG: hypothetical protein NC081_08765 [Roseburia sp.]|nr:hypothetical protein [Roseburia sp.]